MKLLLVTGFLGAGKTAFLKRLIFRFGATARLYVIVNEFGKEGVDGTLLRDSGGIVREIAGGSVFCFCRMEHFETALSEAVAFCSEKSLQENSAAAHNLIVVETSGFSDPTTIAAILAQPRFAPIQYAGCLCLADALFFEKVFTTARAVKKQLGIADVVLLNKSDVASATQKERVQFLLTRNYPTVPVFETVYGELPAAFFITKKSTTEHGIADFLAAISFYANHKKNFEDNAVFQPKDITQQKMTLRILPAMSIFDFEKCVAMFIEDTYRIKGIIQLQEGLFLADCVGNRFFLEPYKATSTSKKNAEFDAKIGIITLLAGTGMNVRKAVTQAAEWYANCIRIENDNN